MGGRDKATIPVESISMLERVVVAATCAGLPVAVIGRKPDQLHFHSHAPLKVMPDATPGQGPLGGLHTAMAHVAPGTGWILLCPCDVPNVNAECFKWLAAQIPVGESAHLEGIVPLWRGQREPFFALYNARIKPAIEAQIAIKNFALQHLIANGNFQFIELPNKFRVAIADIDTEEQLRQLNDPGPNDSEK